MWFRVQDPALRPNLRATAPPASGTMTKPNGISAITKTSGISAKRYVALPSLGLKRSANERQSLSIPTPKGQRVVPVIESTTTNMNGAVYGTSKYLAPQQGAQLIAEAEFPEFSPSDCVCCECLLNDRTRKRTYVRVYDNRVKSNTALAPFCCCTNERCMEDSTRVYFFDNPPHRVGMLFHFIPCVCCGPPVIFIHVPKCCCNLIDLRPCFGESVMYAPANCFGVRKWIFCGSPLYETCATPLFPSENQWCTCPIPMKNSEVFLAKWKWALMRYRDTRVIEDLQRAIFTRVKERPCGVDSVKEIEADFSLVGLPEKAVLSQTMQR
jgi:hypothetical protein